MCPKGSMLQKSQSQATNQNEKVLYQKNLIERPYPQLPEFLFYELIVACVFRINRKHDAKLPLIFNLTVLV